MIGKLQLQIRAQQFAQGLATSDYIGDGGLGTSSANLTPLATPGVMRATATSTPTGSVNGNFLASCEDPRSLTTLAGVTPANKILVRNNGTYYSTTDTTITSRATAGVTTGYATAVTDMVAYGGLAFASRTTDIAMVQVPAIISNAWTITDAWFSNLISGSTLNANAPHPLLVFEDQLWVADGFKLWSVNASLTTATQVLTLNSSNTITSLGIDPVTGLMFLGVRGSGTRDSYTAGSSFIGLYDGYSAKLRRKIPVIGTVSSFQTVGGQVFIFVDNTVNAWNGSGITFLRRLQNVDGTFQRSPYWLMTSSFQNTLLVVDGQNVLAYGDIAQGKKGWYPVYYDSASNINFMTSIGAKTSGSIWSPVIFVANSVGVTFFYPLDTTTAGTGTLYTNYIDFERPVNIHKLRIFTTGITTTAGIGSVAILDENGTAQTVTSNKFVVPASVGTKYSFDFDFGSLKLQSMQPRITLDTQAFGIIKIVVYYDIAE